MFGWSQRSSSDEPPNGTARDVVPWPPPVVAEYEVYKEQLDDAIRAHPPFGAWLRRYRNEMHVLKGGGPAFEGMDVESLKHRYAVEEEKRTHAIHARRYMCELHLREADPADAEYERLCEAWKTGVLEAAARGHNIPKPPPLPESVVARRALEALVEHIETSPERALDPFEVDGVRQAILGKRQHERSDANSRVVGWVVDAVRERGV